MKKRSDAVIDEQHSVLFVYVLKYFIAVIWEVFLYFLYDGFLFVIAYLKGQEAFFLYDLMGIGEYLSVEIKTVIPAK